MNDDLLSERDRELVRLVEQDHVQTGEFIRSVVGTSATIRGWAVTIWLALLGFAFDRDVFELGILAVVVVVAFATIDAYHARLYVQALAHATRLESVLGAYYTALTLSDDDPDAIDDFHDELDSLRPGLYASFRRLSTSEELAKRGRGRRVLTSAGDTWKLLSTARPRLFFSVLYPALLVIATVSAVIVCTT